MLAHWQDEPDIQNTYTYCITDPAERTSEIMDIEKEKQKQAACSTGDHTAEDGSRNSSVIPPNGGDTSGSASTESKEALVYRATTIQILNRIHSVNVLRKIYTMAKRLEECERTGC